MIQPLRLVPGAADFLTDRIDPLEHTVEIPAVRPLPPVPAPRRPSPSRGRELAVCVLLLIALVAAVAAAIAFGLPALVTR